MLVIVILNQENKQPEVFYNGKWPQNTGLHHAQECSLEDLNQIIGSLKKKRGYVLVNPRHGLFSGTKRTKRRKTDINVEIQKDEWRSAVTTKEYKGILQKIKGQTSATGYTIIAKVGTKESKEWTWPQNEAAQLETLKALGESTEINDEDSSITFTFVPASRDLNRAKELHERTTGPLKARKDATAKPKSSGKKMPAKKRPSPAKKSPERAKKVSAEQMVTPQHKVARKQEKTPVETSDEESTVTLSYDDEIPETKISPLEPFKENEWAGILRTKAFDKTLHDGIIRSRLQTMVQNPAFPHYADQNFFKSTNQILFFSDLHADPCRFLVLLYKNKLIEIDDEFENEIKASQNTKSITDLFSDWFVSAEHASKMLTKIRWTDSESKRAILILGDVIDGRRPRYRNRTTRETIFADVPDILTISNEYFIHALLLHLRILASKKGDYIFFCLGNHELMRFKNIRYYAKPRDLEYFEDSPVAIEKYKYINPLVDFYESSPHLFFYVPADNYEQRYVYAAHAELIHRVQSAKAIDNNMETMMDLELKLCKQGAIAFFQDPAVKKILESLILQGSAHEETKLTGGRPRERGPFWNRTFYELYGDHKQGELEKQIGDWRKNKHNIKHFVAGHTVVGISTEVGTSSILHHFHEDDRLLDFYWFVDKGLSRCFDPVKTEKELARLKRKYLSQNPLQLYAPDRERLNDVGVNHLKEWIKKLRTISTVSQFNELNIDWSLLRFQRGVQFSWSL